MQLQAEQVVKAAAALLRFEEKRNEGSNQLIAEDQFVHLVVGLKETDAKFSNIPVPVPVPNPIFGQDASVCLIVKDPGQDIRQQLKDNPIPFVKKVLPLAKLRKNYNTHQARRQLLSRFDLFVTDDRILPLLPARIGTKFFLKKKQPVPVRLTGGDFAGRIQKLLESVFVFRSRGPSWMVRIGNTSHTPQQIAENVLKASDRIASCVPRGWPNVQSLWLKTNESVALPIFLRPANQPSQQETTAAINEQVQPTKSATQKKQKQKQKKKPQQATTTTTTTTTDTTASREAPAPKANAASSPKITKKSGKVGPTKSAAKASPAAAATPTIAPAAAAAPSTKKTTKQANKVNLAAKSATKSATVTKSKVKATKSSKAARRGLVNVA